MNPAEAAAAIRFLGYAEDLHAFREADRPHVLVCILLPERLVGAIRGPYPDAFAAEAAKDAWQAEVQVGDDDPIEVEIHPLFAVDQ